MSAAHPFPPAELEEALRKVAKREPLRRDEQELVIRTLGERRGPPLPLADLLTA